jgi:signal transduction histidine kinase
MSSAVRADEPSPTPAQDVLRGIVEHLADGIVVVDRGGSIRFVNPAAEALFQRRAEALTSAPFGFPLVVGETTEIEVVRPGGDVVTAELRVVDSVWDGVPASLVSLRDVTDRKLAEQRERELAEERSARLQAEAASQAKSQFLTMMSHELRTPLNAVLGYADLLSLGIAGPLTDAQRQQLERIVASGRHLLELVNEILDLARVEAGRLTVTRIPMAVVPAVDASLVLVQPLAEAHGLTIAARVDRSARLVALGDEHRVRQILVNLLSNAVKFTPAGGSVRIVVETTTRPDAEAKLHAGSGTRPWIALRVHDSGRGIAADQLERVFAPFVQGEHGLTRGRDGSGLGLAISRRLARLMSGDVTARSTLGEGSTFTLWLPAADAPPAPARLALLSGRDPQVRGLGEVGDALLREVEPVVDTFVERLRTEPVCESARDLRYSQLTDHVATLIADIAGALTVLEEAAGQPSSLLDDGADIRRLVAERHGQQRARLGWTEEEVRREYAILREELLRAIRRCFTREDDVRVLEASAVVTRMLDDAEGSSLRTLAQARAAPESG